MELMNNNAEQFYQALNIPYRIVGIVSGSVFFSSRQILLEFFRFYKFSSAS